MHAVLNKLVMNFTPAHVQTLGARQYLKLLAQTVLNSAEIRRTRDLRPLDRAMGRSATTIDFMGRSFVVDCRATDACVEDGTFTFGLVRELFLRNCYVREGVIDALEHARYVLDLGANRGLFSVMAAQTAELVIAVEVLPSLAEAIRINARANGLRNIRIESAFVGRGGRYQDRSAEVPVVSIANLLDRYDIEFCDLVKMDIEGSEFALFDESAWVSRVGALAMETHPDHGDVSLVVERLEDAGFTVKCGNALFQQVSRLEQADFLWAWRQTRTWPPRSTAHGQSSTSQSGVG